MDSGSFLLYYSCFVIDLHFWDGYFSHCNLFYNFIPDYLKKKFKNFYEISFLNVEEALKIHSELLSPFKSAILTTKLQHFDIYENSSCHAT